MSESISKYENSHIFSVMAYERIYMENYKKEAISFLLRNLNNGQLLIDCPNVTV